jgi:hypothetical protein
MTTIDTTIEIGEECCICYSEFDDETKVLFQDNPDSEWKLAAYCYDCTQHLKKTLWDKYKNDVEKADCKRSLRNALKSGPPINIRDIGFPCENESGEVYKAKCNEKEFSPKLEGVFEGKNRQDWWDHYKAIMNAMDEIKEEDEKSK